MNGSVIRARNECIAPSSVGKKLSTARRNIAIMTVAKIRRRVITVRVKIISMIKAFLRS